MRLSLRIFGPCASFALPLSVASLACASIVTGYDRVFRRELVAVGTVRLPSLLRPGRFPAKGKPGQVGQLFRGHDLIVGQSALGASNNCIGLNANSLRQLNGPISLAFNFDKDRSPLVPLLLLSIRPPAIFRRVSKAVVDTVKRMAQRAISHVGGKLSVGIPLSADGNASASVVGPLPVIWIKAAISHRSPYMIKRGLVLEWHPRIIADFGTKRHGGMNYAA